MVARTIYACDRCGSEPADQFRIDLGRGGKAVDLCEHCQKETGLLAVAELLDQFGVVAQSQPKAKPKPAAHEEARSKEVWDCPVCGAERGGRTGVIKHMVTQHGMTKVEASHRARPEGPTIKCAVCDFLTVPGTGYAAHVITDHGAEEWDRIKASL